MHALSSPGAAPLADSAAFRQSLEARGPLFVKLGQFLALRPDLIDQQHCDELLRLVDRVPPFPWPEVSRIFTADLGRTPEDCFAFIDRRPLASASLAQVHAARTHGGRQVVVKVLRPQVREQIERAFADPEGFAAIWNAAGAAQIAPATDVREEFRRWLTEEIDFSRELHNMERLRRFCRRSRIALVPRAYPRLSSERVITQDLFQGVPFSELLELVREGRGESIAAMGLDPERLANNLLTSMFTQVFRYRFFHADAHPGNLIALEGNLVGFVDLGLAEVLDDTFRDGMLRYLGAVYRGDAKQMYRGLLELLITDEESDLDGFREDFAAESLKWRRESSRGPASKPGERSPAADYLVGILGAARRRGLRVPPSMLAIYRSLLAAETVANRLGTRANLRRVGRTFFERLQRDTFVNALRDQARLRTWLVDTGAALMEAPRQLQQLITDITDRRLVLRMHTVASRTDRELGNRRARLITAALLQVALALLVVGADRLSVSFVRPLRVTLASLLLVGFGYLVLLWRRLR